MTDGLFQDLAGSDAVCSELAGGIGCVRVGETSDPTRWPEGTVITGPQLELMREAWDYMVATRAKLDEASDRVERARRQGGDSDLLEEASEALNEARAEAARVCGRSAMGHWEQRRFPWGALDLT